MKQWMVMAALTAMAAAASATTESRTVDWGTHLATETGANSIVAPTDSFDDLYTFTLSSSSKLSDYAFTTDVSSVTNLAGSVLSLYRVGDSTALGTFAFDGLTGGSHNFGSFGAGSYYYEVTGHLADLANNGSYTFVSSAVAAVPEPASMALMLAGLGLMGVVARRRQNRG